MADSKMPDVPVELVEDSESEEATEDPEIDAGFLRHCARCKQTAYLRKGGCANPACEAWLIFFCIYFIFWNFRVFKPEAPAFQEILSPVFWVHIFPSHFAIPVRSCTLASKSLGSGTIPRRARLRRRRCGRSTRAKSTRRWWLASRE